MACHSLNGFRLNGVSMMDKGSLAAMELMVALGLAGWLFYYQFMSSRRGSDRQDEGSAKAKDAGDPSSPDA